MGGGNGGGLLRSVGRVVTSTRANFAGGPLPDSISSSSSSCSSSTSTGNGNNNNNNNNSRTSNTPRHAQKEKSSSTLSLSSPFASCNVPVSSVYGFPTSPPPSWPHSDDSDWVAVDGFVDDAFVLGPVPSEDEVHSAVSALQQVFNQETYSNLVRDKFAPDFVNGEEHQVMSPTDLVHQISPVGSELDWMEPSVLMCNSKMLQPYGSERVYDAFHLLQTDPLVQNMVKSLSSDEAVWNAVLNNAAVRELRDSFCLEDSRSKSTDESSDGSNEETNIVTWIFNGARAKIMEVVEKITKLVNDLFQPPENEKTSDSGGTDPFKEKLRTSFMLTIMVLLVVVVARAHKS